MLPLLPPYHVPAPPADLNVTPLFPPMQAPTMRAVLAIALLALLAAPALAFPGGPGGPGGPGNKPGSGHKPLPPKPFKAQGNGTQERGAPRTHRPVKCISVAVAC